MSLLLSRYRKSQLIYRVRQLFLGRYRFGAGGFEFFLPRLMISKCLPGIIEFLTQFGESLLGRRDLLLKRLFL